MFWPLCQSMQNQPHISLKETVRRRAETRIPRVSHLEGRTFGPGRWPRSAPRWRSWSPGAQSQPAPGPSSRHLAERKYCNISFVPRVEEQKHGTVLSRMLLNWTEDINLQQHLDLQGFSLVKFWTSISSDPVNISGGRMMWCYVWALIFIDPSRRQVQHLISGSPQGGGSCPMLPPHQQVLDNHPLMLFPKCVLRGPQWLECAQNLIHVVNIHMNSIFQSVVMSRTHGWINSLCQFYWNWKKSCFSSYCLGWNRTMKSSTYNWVYEAKTHPFKPWKEYWTTGNYKNHKVYQWSMVCGLKKLQ